MVEMCKHIHNRRNLRLHASIVCRYVTGFPFPKHKIWMYIYLSRGVWSTGNHFAYAGDKYCIFSTSTFVINDLSFKESKSE